MDQDFTTDPGLTVEDTTDPTGNNEVSYNATTDLVRTKVTRESGHIRGSFPLDSTVTASEITLTMDGTYIEAIHEAGFGICAFGVGTQGVVTETFYSGDFVGFGVYSDNSSNHDQAVLGLVVVDGTNGFQFISELDLNGAFTFSSSGADGSTTEDLEIVITTTTVTLSVGGVAYQDLTDGFTAPDWLGSSVAWSHFVSGGLEDIQGTNGSKAKDVFGIADVADLSLVDSGGGAAVTVTQPQQIFM